MDNAAESFDLCSASFQVKLVVMNSGCSLMQNSVTLEIVSLLCATIDPYNQTETCSFHLTYLDTVAPHSLHSATQTYRLM